MSIYLGGNNSRPYVGGTKITEAYLGGVKVLNLGDSDGAITISMSVSGTGYSPSKTFGVSITFSEAIQYTVDGQQISAPSAVCNIALKHGDSTTIGKIPAGVEYSIAEDQLSYPDTNAGYSLGNVTNPTGTMPTSGDISSIATIEFDANSCIIGGKKYRTVVIGNQRWLAENLDFQFSGASFNPGTDSRSLLPSSAAYYYYNRASHEYASKYGLLYNHAAVTLLNNNRGSLCPGWRVPTTTDFNSLSSYIGSSPAPKLASTTGWASTYGTDDYGFTAYPAGHIEPNGFSGDIGVVAYFSVLDTTWGYTQFMTIQRTRSTLVKIHGQYQELSGASLRLIYG